MEIGTFDTDDMVKCEQGCRERGSVHGDGCCQSQTNSDGIECIYYVGGKREEDGDDKSKAVECRKSNNILIIIWN